MRALLLRCGGRWAGRLNKVPLARTKLINRWASKKPDAVNIRLLISRPLRTGKGGNYSMKSYTPTQQNAKLDRIGRAVDLINSGAIFEHHKGVWRVLTDRFAGGYTVGNGTCDCYLQRCHKIGPSGLRGGCQRRIPQESFKAADMQRKAEEAAAVLIKSQPTGGARYGGIDI